jgi:regulator of protease activity HflC (stomatin/prohibitin superfamily)
MKKKYLFLVVLVILGPLFLTACNDDQVIASTDTSDYVSSMLATTIKGSSLGAGMLMAVVALIFGIGASIGIVYLMNRRRQRPLSNVLGVAAIFIAVTAIVFGIGSFNASYVVIDEGEVGVVVQQGEYVETIYPGPSFMLPYLQKTVIYTTREFTFATMSNPIEQGSEQYRTWVMDVTTSDGVTGNIPFLVQAKVNPAQAEELYRTYGTLENAVVQLIKSPSLSMVRDSMRGKKAEDIAKLIDTHNSLIEDDLGPIMEKGGLTLTRFTFRKPDFLEWEIERNATVVAEQQALKEKNLAEVAKQQKQAEFYKAEINANIARENAQGAADSAVIAAEGQAQVTQVNADADAYAILAKANAEAEANQAVSQSLTGELIDYRRWLAWNGQWPSTYFEGGDETLLIEIPVTE